jgi:glutamate formiminotransferase
LRKNRENVRIDIRNTAQLLRGELGGYRMIKNLAAILKKHKKWRLGEDE